MADLLAEVDEMMKQERMEKLWKTHGKILITAVIFIILGTAAISGYGAWTSHVNTTDTDQVLALLEAPDYPINILDAEINVRPSLKGIALLSAASSFLSERQSKEAKILYDRVAKDSSVSKEQRQLAILMQARINSDQGEPLESVIGNLEIIWSDEKSPWRYHAGLELAALHAEKSELDKALTYLNDLMDTPALPQSLYNKARALSHVYYLRQGSSLQKESESK